MSALENITRFAEPAFKWIGWVGGLLITVLTLAFFAGDHWTTWSKVRQAEKEGTVLFASADFADELSARLDGLERALGRTDSADGSVTTRVDQLAGHVGRNRDRLAVVETAVSQMITTDDVEGIVLDASAGSDPKLVVQSGEVEIHYENQPELLMDSYDADGHCIAGERAYRGIVKAWQPFDQEFKLEPKVVMGLSSLGVDHKSELRIDLVVNTVKKDGFFYSFYTWCNTRVYAARGAWVAVGQ